MADKITDAEAIRKLRENLLDLISLCERTHCTTVKDLLGVCELALDNEGQARMLVEALSQKR